MPEGQAGRQDQPGRGCLSTGLGTDNSGPTDSLGRRVKEMHRLDGHASGHIGHVDLAGLGSLIEVPVAQALLPVP